MLNIKQVRLDLLEFEWHLPLALLHGRSMKYLLLLSNYSQYLLLLLCVPKLILMMNRWSVTSLCYASTSTIVVHVTVAHADIGLRRKLFINPWKGEEVFRLRKLLV